MIRLSDDEWKQVKETLSQPYGIVQLQADEYKVTVVCQPTSNILKCELVIYIDGKLKIAWAMEDCDIRRRFFSKHTRSTLKAADKRTLKKIPKKERERIENKSKYEIYYPSWNSFNRMKSHFIKNNADIKLLRI